MIIELRQTNQTKLRQTALETNDLLYLFELQGLRVIRCQICLEKETVL